MTTEQFQNQTQPAAILTLLIAANATSCIVSNPANFSVLSAGQQFQMSLQDTPNSPVEQVTVTATNGATFTIERGINAMAHAAGAAVAQVVTAAQLAAMYPNGAVEIGSSPISFDGSLPVMEINPATPQAITVNILTEKLVPFRVYTVADGSGAAATHNITLTPDAGQIGGASQPSPASTYVINVNGASAKFYWNGTNCRLV